MNTWLLQAYHASKKTPLLSVKVWQQIEIQEKIGEWNNARTWKFKGLVIKVKNPNQSVWSFTVRGTSSGMTIEKIYPLSYTKFVKVTLLDEYKIRKAKLYYIRDKVGKASRMKSIITSNRRNSILSAS
jgi:large subunit ribosomal protein L19